jgi:hypothetical protein
MFEGTSCTSSLQLTQIAALTKLTRTSRAQVLFLPLVDVEVQSKMQVKTRSVKGGERDQAILAPEASQ